MTSQTVTFYQTLSDEALEKDTQRKTKLDSKYLLEWSNDSSFSIFCEDEDERKTYTRHLEPVIGILPLKHQKNKGRFISVGLDNSIQLSLNHGPQLHALDGHDDRIIGLIELSNGDLASASIDGVLRFWNIHKGILKSEIEASLSSLDDVKLFAYNQIVAIKENDSVSLWRFSGEQIVELKGHKQQVQSAHRLGSKNWLIWTENSKPTLWDEQGKLLKTFPFSFSPDSDYCELDSNELLIQKTNGTICLFDAQGELKFEHQNNAEVTAIFEQLTKCQHLSEDFIADHPSVSHFKHARNFLGSRKSYFTANNELEQQNLNFANDETAQKVWNFFSRPVFDDVKTALKNVVKTARNQEKKLSVLSETAQEKLKRFQRKLSINRFFTWSFFLLTVIGAGAAYYLMQQPDLLKSLVDFERDLVKIAQKEPQFIVAPPVALLAFFWLIFANKTRKQKKNIKKEQANIAVQEVVLNAYHQLIDSIKNYRKNLTAQIPVLQKDNHGLYQGDFIRQHIDGIIYGKLKDLAMNECGLDKKDIIYTDHEPIVLPALSLIQDKDKRKAFANKLVAENEYSFWAIKGGSLVSAVQYIQYTFLTKDKIDVFTTYYDFITNKVVGKEANAFYYKDVTNATKREVDREDFWEGNGDELSATEIVLSVASGEKIRLTILNEDSLSKLQQQTKEVETIDPEMLLNKLEDERQQIIDDDDLSEEDKEDELLVVDGRIAEAKASLFELDSTQSDNKADEAIKNIRSQLDQHKKES